MESTHSEKSIKSVLAKATRHQIANSDKIPYLSNPLLIALFLKTRSAVEGEKLDLNSLPAAMEEFDKRNHDFIQELTKQMEGSEKDDSILEADGELLDEEKPEERTPAIETDVYNKFMELVPAEKQEQVEEDLEVFLVDFEPPPISEWDSELIKNFLEKWFLENANPLEEDLVSMRQTLLSLFKFPCKRGFTTGWLTEYRLQEYTKSLKDFFRRQDKLLSMLGFKKEKNKLCPNRR